MTTLNIVPSREYTRNKGKWSLMRAVRAGQDAIHEGGETYLPRLSGQDDDKYAAYKARAEFFNATDRTATGMVGMAFRNSPNLNSDVLGDLVDNISTRGQSLSEYARYILDEFLTTGRCGTLVDYPEASTAPSVAAARLANVRPVLAFYAAEDIINWEYGQAGATYKLIKLTLREETMSEQGTEFEHQYRVLSIDEGGNYIQELFDSGGNIINEAVTPKIGGKPFKEIPFFFHVETPNGEDIEPPPLYDLATLNIKHYQLKADHAHALHYVAMPTPWVTGIDKDEAPDNIGPDSLWTFESAETKVGLLEFEGKGLDAVEKEVEAKERRMAALGARIISGDNVTPETATAAGINYQSEMSTLSKAAVRRSDEFTAMLKLVAEWNGTSDEELEYEFNKDFMPAGMDPNKIVALVSSWIQGAISKETMFQNLKAGEVIAPDVTFEDEEERIEAAPPPKQGGQADLGDDE